MRSICSLICFYSGIAWAGYGDLPLVFEPRGEHEAVARGSGYEVVAGLGRTELRVQGGAVQMRFRGAATVTPRLVERLPGHSNYIIGARSQWRMSVPHYAKVRYDGLWPGIDLVLYGAGGYAEYDFVVGAEADLSRVSFALDGAEGLHLDDEGNLRVKLAGGEIVHRKPVIYQEVKNTRQRIEGSYVLQGNTVGFLVAEHDRKRPLVIDPVLVYATYLGGASNDRGTAIAADTAGNAYVAGSTGSPNFPLVSADQSTQGGIFVARLNAAGTALLYSTYFGAGGTEEVTGIAVDAQGAAYVVGRAGSPAFPTTPGAFKTAVTGQNDGFLAKFDSNGALVYSTLLGGSGTDSIQGVAVDSSGFAYVAGETSSPDFPTTAGGFDTTYPGQQSAFAAKVNANGTALVYSTYLDYGVANGIAVNGAGEAFLAGIARQFYPTTVSAYQVSCGTGSGFATRLTSAGNGLVYSTCTGGENYAVAVDGNNNAYVSGGLIGNNGRPGVRKLNPSGSVRVYEADVDPGSTGGPAGRGLEVDSAGNAYLSALLGGQVVAVRVTPEGTVGSFRILTGMMFDSGVTDVALDSHGMVYVTGSTDVTGVATTGGAYDTTVNGAFDAFVAKVDLSDTVTIPVRIETRPLGLSVTVDGATMNAPRDYGWAPNSRHSIAVTTPQPGPTGVRYELAQWSPINIRDSSFSYLPSLSGSNTLIASFDAAYQWTVSASPAAGGFVVVWGMNQGWVTSAMASTSMEAVPNQGWQFVGWTGDITPSANRIGSAAVDQPRTIVGNFSPCTVSVSPLVVVLGPGNSFGNVRVDARAGCAWSFEVPANSWFHAYVLHGNRLGPGTLSVLASNYASHVPRSGVITIGGHAVTVIQRQPSSAWRHSTGALRLHTNYGPSAPELSGAFASDPALTQTPLGDSIAVARDNFQGLWVAQFFVNTNAWGPLTFIGGRMKGKPSITMASNGTAYIAARDQWDAYWVTSFTPGSGARSWQFLGGVFGADPVIAAGSGDSVYVIGKDKWDGLWSNRLAIGGEWLGWRYGGGIVKGMPSVTVGDDNIAYVVVRDNWDSVWMARVRQETWLGFLWAAGVVAADPQVARLHDSLQFVSLDGSGNIWQRGWYPAESAFSAWRQTWAAFTEMSVCSAGAVDLLVAGRSRPSSLLEVANLSVPTKFVSTLSPAGPVQCAPR